MFVTDDVPRTLRRLESGRAETSDPDVVHSMSYLPFSAVRRFGRGVMPRDSGFLHWAPSGELLKTADVNKPYTGAPRVFAFSFRSRGASGYTLAYCVRGAKSVADYMTSTNMGSGLVMSRLPGARRVFSPVPGVQVHKGLWGFGVHVASLVSASVHESLLHVAAAPDKVVLYGASLGGAAALIAAHVLNAELDLPVALSGGALDLAGMPPGERPDFPIEVHALASPNYARGTSAMSMSGAALRGTRLSVTHVSNLEDSVIYNAFMQASGLTYPVRVGRTAALSDGHGVSRVVQADPFGRLSSLANPTSRASRMLHSAMLHDGVWHISSETKLAKFGDLLDLLTAEQCDVERLWLAVRRLQELTGQRP